MTSLDNISGAPPPVLPFPLRVVRPESVPTFAVPAAAGAAVAAVTPGSGASRFSHMSREELRPLLSSYFQQYWNSPEDLAALVARALDEGWAPQSIDAAQQLARIDPDPQRGARLLATALIDLGRFADAEPILTAALQPQQPPLAGPDRAALLTLMARAQMGHGDLPAAERSLWQALTSDPNAEDALHLYAALARTRGGTTGELEAYQHAAEMPGSWRASLWLARNALQTPSAGFPAAVVFYQKVLQQTPPPLPAELLARMSSDLAGRGLLDKMVELVEPHYDPAPHGLPVGETLLRAFLDIHDDAGARRIFSLLAGQQRPDWSERLRAWEGEIGRASPGYRAVSSSRTVPAATGTPVENAGSAENVGTPVSQPVGVPSAPGEAPGVVLNRTGSTKAPDRLPFAEPGEAPLPGSSPEELVAYIVRTLRAGRAGECLPGARQLANIDPQPHRAAQLLATTLLRLSCFPEVELVLAEALRQPGADQALLLTLAGRARAGEGDPAGAEMKFWQALMADSNAEEALHSFAALHREAGGDGAVPAYRRAAELPGSWRAPLWLAQEALHQPDTGQGTALDLYQNVLLRTPPVPAEALAQLTAEVNKHGLMKELIAASALQFDPVQHGLPAGSTLIRGALDVGDTAAAQRLLQLLYAQQRPEWREAVQFWQRELDKRHQAFRRHSGAGFEIVDDYDEMQILSVDGPIWARAGSDDPFLDLVPAKTADAIRVAFFCGSLFMPPAPAAGERLGVVAPPPAAALGRFTRGLPLFLAERVHLQTDANTLTLVPRSKRGGGFVLSSQPWTASALAVMLAMEKSQRPDYVVLFHLITSRDSAWRAQFQLAHVHQQATVGRWEESFTPDDLAATVDRLTQRVLRELTDTIPRLVARPAPVGMLPATVGQLPGYLSELEHMLATWCGVAHR